MGLAVGAALAGRRPVVEIMFIDFITLAMDQLVNHAAKLRYMTGGQLRVPLTDPGAGRRGRRHGRPPLAEPRGVVRPRPGPDGRGARPRPPTPGRCSRAAIRSDDPVVFLEHRGAVLVARATVAATAASTACAARAARPSAAPGSDVDDRRLVAHGRHGAGGRRAARRGRHRRRGHRPAQPRSRSTSTTVVASVRPDRSPGRRPRGGRDRRASAPRSRPRVARASAADAAGAGPARRRAVRAGARRPRARGAVRARPTASWRQSGARRGDPRPDVDPEVTP